MLSVLVLGSEEVCWTGVLCFGCGCGMDEWMDGNRMNA
jgi:hypothetical protein